MTWQLPHHLWPLARRVAQHEMGHYVVARALGFRTGDVSIEITGPFDGHYGGAAVTLPEPLSSLSDVQTYLERRVLVLYAGAAAETLPLSAPEKRVDNDLAVKTIRNPEHGTEQDHAKARELIHVLRNISDPAANPTDDIATQAQLDELDAKLWRRAVELVESYAETIVALGDNLATRVHKPKERVTLNAKYLESLPSVQKIVAVRPFED